MNENEPDGKNAILEKIIIVRHGKHGSDGHLNMFGEKEIATLIEQLKPILKGHSILIVSSSKPRASDSAKMIANAYPPIVPVEIYDFLGYCNPQCAHAYKLVESHENEANIIIIVTHYEYSMDFPDYLMAQRFGIKIDNREALGNAEAWIIDCASKTITKI